MSKFSIDKVLCVEQEVCRPDIIIGLRSNAEMFQRKNDALSQITLQIVNITLFNDVWDFQVLHNLSLTVLFVL